MAKILIIDDDEGMCFILAGMVRQTGHDTTCAYTLAEGLKAASSGVYDVVFLDVQMPDGNGLDVLPQIMKTASKPELIIITGQGDPDGAELAIKNGAWDYIEKPSSIEEMTLPLLRALQYRKEKMVKKPLVALNREGIIGDSPKIRACLDLLTQAASSEVNVLLTGETGTGKEIFARAIHKNSTRCGNDYVVVDCAALPGTLMESTLFGHEKGAFTGADKAVEGLIKHADGGTLLLDEVGELSLSAQKAFLRVLQERSFRPVGSNKEIKSDFRLIASTNRNLDRMVQQEKFRSDLLFRLRSFYIELSPLRERKEDIKDLVFYYMAKFCERNGTITKGFSPEFFETLTLYHWPGNVRELINSMERVLTISGSEPVLFPKHLPNYIRINIKRSSVGKKVPVEPISKEAAGPAAAPTNLQDFRESMEEKYFRDLLHFTRGNIKEALRISGISRTNLYAHLKKYKISTLDC